MNPLKRFLGRIGSVCPECEADRVARWERMRARNGLTEEEWPRPVGPRIVGLEAHRRAAHSGGTR